MSREFDWAASMEQRERDNCIARARAAETAGAGGGMCEDCGCAIPAKRLALHPAARRCVSCQAQVERR
jgi:DnaK suppressor protein